MGGLSCFLRRGPTVSMNDMLFPTFVVGSLPRPQWVRDVIEDRKAGRVGAAEADTLLDDAVMSAIRMQERAGVDYVSDGEWRRESYVKVFTEGVDGFTNDLIVSGGSSSFTQLSYPVVTSRMTARRQMVAAEAEFLRERTDSMTIVAAPSPYTIGRRMWSAEHSSRAYPTREEFIDDCIPIVNREVHRLAEIGVDMIQLDDPWLALLVDPAYRERAGIDDVEHEIELSVRAVNGAVDGVRGAEVSVHLCHAHFNRVHGSKGPYDLIMGALGRMNVDRFAMEFATPDAGGIDVLAEFPDDKTLGLGVIDHTDQHVEIPQEVVDRVDAAMRFIPKERITLNPDCGFSPSSVNPMDFDEAYLKLAAMSDGAAQLRERYGG